MSLLRRYTTSNLSSLMNDIWNLTPIDYSPRYYRQDRWISESDTSGRLEVELPGYSKDLIEVYTENNSVFISAKKSIDTTTNKYFRSWSLGPYERVGAVKYENGLLSVEISKVVPEEHKRQTHKIE